MSRINIKNDFQDGNTLYGDELNINNNVIMAGVNDNFERIEGNDEDISALDGRVTQNEEDISLLDGRVTQNEEDISDLQTNKANKSEVNAAIDNLQTNKADKTDLNNYYTKSQIDNTLDNYATKTYVSTAIEEAIDIPPETIAALKELAEDLDDIAMKEDLPTKTSDLLNDSNFAVVSKVKNITLLTTGWVQNQTSELYEYTINDSDVTTSSYLTITGTIDNQILKDNEVESFTNYYVIRTSELPEENISANVKIETVNVVTSS